jgi:hypothetical protein
MLSYGTYFIIAVLLTLVVEIPILFLTAKYLIKVKIRTKEILYWGFFVSLFSLPYLWFVFPLFITSSNYILIGEVLVITIETIIFLKVFKINIKKALILSLLANLASYLAGVLLGGII